jgi:drug/metabolite transporter (DMT)-like permease
MTALSIPAAASERTRGLILVAGAELAWSLGGMISRFISVSDEWTIVFWRGLFAGIFLFGFMLLRDGPRQTIRSFAVMGLPGLAVALCFAFCSSSFVIALAHTQVANILVLQAATPLMAALIGWAVFGERAGLATWLAIAAVVLGVVIMMSGSLSGNVSWLGDGLALLIALVFAIAIVLTRRYAAVQMLPANCLGMLIACIVAATQAGYFTVDTRELLLLFAFGAINLGAGLAFFAMGARLIPAILVGLMSMIEPVLGPIWVWLVHHEVPGTRTLIGGGIILASIVLHVLWQASRREESVSG